MKMLKVYKIYNANDTDDANVYIGVTRQKRLSERFGHHMLMLRAGVDRKLYNHMREAGPENFKIVLLHTEPVDSMEQQKTIQERFIDDLKPTLNTDKLFIVDRQAKEGI